MTHVDLAIKGDIEVLRLAPGDTIVITVERPLSHEQVQKLREQAEEQFTGHRIVVTHGVRLSVQRNEERA